MTACHRPVPRGLSCLAPRARGISPDHAQGGPAPSGIGMPRVAARLSTPPGLTASPRLRARWPLCRPQGPRAGDRPVFPLPQDAFRIGRCRVFMAPDRGPMSPRSDPCHEATMLSAAEVRASEDVAGSGAPIDEPGSAATTYASRAEGPPHARAGRATRRSRVGSRPPREARGRLSGRGAV